MTKPLLTAAVAVAALLLAAPFPALAQMQGQQQHSAQDQGGSAPPATSAPGMAGPRTMGPGMMQRMPQEMMPGMMSGGAQMPMMGGSASGMGMDMMNCPMMAQMMRMHPEMMAMMHDGMRSGDGMMMGQGMGSGMMRGHGGPGAMMGQRGGAGTMMREGDLSLDTGIVTSVQHLSTDDVRDFFVHRLQRIGNDRLKLGQVTQTDEDTITAEIVTLDDSLVDRLKVDRHSGKIERTQ